jgi:hypothetical protein
LLVLLAGILGPIVGYPENWFISLSVQAILAPFLSLRRLVRLQKREGAWYEAIAQYPANIDPVLYSSGQDELRFTKNLQWNLVYYILLIYGVIFAIGSLVPGSAPSPRAIVTVLLYFLDVLTLAYGLYFICELQYKLRNYRIQIDKSKFYKHSFFENGVFNRKRYKAETENDARFWRDPRVTVVLMISTILGYLIVAFSLWDSLRVWLVDHIK